MRQARTDFGQNARNIRAVPSWSKTAVADELPQVRELDCNPVVVRPDGVVAIDIKIHLARTPEHHRNWLDSIKSRAPNAAPGMPPSA